MDPNQDATNKSPEGFILTQNPEPRIDVPKKTKIILASVIFLIAISIAGFAFYTFQTSPNLASKTSSNTSQSNTEISITTDVKTVPLSEIKETDLSGVGHDLSVTSLPLGDKKYVTDKPKKGYVFLCQLRQGGGGASQVGPWISGSVWNKSIKPSVQGKVTWTNAYFSSNISGSNRVLAGNDLPVNGYTGTFPVQASDPAYQYDKNPNSIAAQTYSNSFPISPAYYETPNCMGGEVGIMTNGVALFNGFDAEYRDAAAHEVQDSCDGHPEKTGEYHYHSLSKCMNNIDVTNVIGYALDGFPITGPKLQSGKYLMTDDLDECHGIKSTINLDGKSVSTYHYVMTVDFPYSVSCFRGKPVQMQVLKNMQQSMQGTNGSSAPSQSDEHATQDGQQNNPGNSQMRTPPQEAITACSGKSSNASCSFTSPTGSISGTCQTPPGQNSVICVPSQEHQN